MSFRNDILDFVKAKFGKRLMRYPSPVAGDLMVVEKGTRDKNTYAATPKGTAHPTQAGLRLIDEIPTEGEDNQLVVTYIYGNENSQTLQDNYNYAKDYAAGSNTTQIYSRTYRDVLRSAYERTGPRAKAAPLTSLIGIDITAGGTGYAASFAVTFTGGSGSGAAATAYSLNGVITNIVITNAGTGYTSAPTSVLTAGGGTGGAATALLQPAAAVLVDEKMFPAEGADNALFCNVTCIYEVLPGPWVPFTRYDTFMGPVQGQRRAVLNTAQTASLTATVKTTYEGRDGSSIVSLQIQETNSNGSGSGGNPAFPILDTDFYDNERGPVQQRTQLITATGSEAGTQTSNGTTITKTSYEPFEENSFLLKKVIETWLVLGVSLTGTTQNAQGISGTLSSRLVAPGTSVTTGADVRSSVVNAVSAVQSKKETETGVLWGTSGQTSEFGIAGQVDVAVASSDTISTGIDIVSSDSTPEDALRFRNKTVTIPFSGSSATLNEYDERGDPIATVTTWSSPSATPATESETVRVRRTLESISRARSETSTASRSPLISKEFGFAGGLDVSTNTLVAPSTTPTNSGATVQKLTAKRKGEAELLSIVYATGVHTVEIEKVDPNIPGSRATVDFSLALASTTIPADTSIIDYTRKRFDANELLKVEIKTTYAIPPDFVEYRDMSAAFPAYFYYYFSNDLQGVTKKGRAGYSVNKPHKISHTFSSTIPAAPVPYQIIENDLLLFSAHIAGLMDADTLTHTDIYGNVYTQSIPASTPDYTTYTGLVGTLAVVGGSVEIYRAGIYHKITIETILQ